MMNILIKRLALAANLARRTVRVGDLRCGHCGRVVQAFDVDLDDGDVRVICAGCHRDLLHIERAALGA